MNNIRMFRTISGEDVIAEFVRSSGSGDKGDVYINPIQLMVVPSKHNPQEVNYGFAPYPQYARPKSEAEITFNPNNIVFYIDIDPDFLDQYKAIFGHIVAPSPKIVL